MTEVPGTLRRHDSLDGTWSFVKDEDGSLDHGQAEDLLQDPSAGQMAVPDNWWFTELKNYYGVVWFGRTFGPVDDVGVPTVTLRFEAVDYIADVWLNGTYLGRHEGTFAPFEFRVDGALRGDADNHLVVRVDAPWNDTEVDRAPQPHDRWITEEPYTSHWPREVKLVKGGLIDQMHKPGGFTSFWQDGNTGGIWNSVTLVRTGAAVLTTAKVTCKVVQEAKSPEGLIAIDVTVDNNSGAALVAELVLDVAGENFDLPAPVPTKVRPAVLPPGRSVVKVVHTIADPQQWDTWDVGFPHLYRLVVGLRVDGEWLDTRTEVTGFKDLHVDMGTKQFFLNGRRLFLRGMRYSSSSWYSESVPRYERDVPAIKAANQNAIRIGSHVERREFYEMCDREGLLVWQVGPFHYCVSDSDDMVERGSEQVREMVEMLHNHVSIGLWSTFKEPEVYNGRQEFRPNNYNRLCEVAAETARSVDPNRWVHKGDYRDNVQNVTVGEILPASTDLSRLHLEPIIIEYGAASIPVLESIREFLPEEDIWPPNWDSWARHGFWPGYLEHWEIPLGDSIEELIEKTQEYHAMNTKEIVEYFRRRKYSPITSIWHYFWSEQFPGFGSGMVDYFGRPYKAAAMLGPASAPLLVSVEWVKDAFVVGKPKTWRPKQLFESRIWITNDLFDGHEDCRLRTRLSKDGEPVLERERAGITVAADSSTVADHLAHRLVEGRGHYRVDVELVGAGGDPLATNFFDFEVY